MVSRGKYQGPDLQRSADLPCTKGELIHLPPRLAGEATQQEWLARVNDPTSIITLDLFSGCGGMSQGFEDAGFFVAAAIDALPSACETHAANFLSKSIHADIHTIDPQRLLDELGLPRVDVIIGGPPCQGFSVVGRARVRSLLPEQQEEILARNDLYLQYLRFVEALNPLMFIMENVPHFKTYEDGVVYKNVIAECDRLGYFHYDNMLVASDFGVPQMRRRLFIVGSRIGRIFMWPRPTHATHPVSLSDAIGDLPAVQPPSLAEALSYADSQPLSAYVRLMRSRVAPSERQIVRDHIVRPVRDDDRKIFAKMRPGSKYRDIDAIYKRYGNKSFHDRYLMLNPNLPCNTITAHMAKDGYRYIHWDTAQLRTLSVREAARVQSFGDHFRFAGSRTGRFVQIGNAVPPLLAEALGRQVRRAIQRHRSFVQGDRIDAIMEQSLPWTETEFQVPPTVVQELAE